MDTLPPASARPVLSPDLRRVAALGPDGVAVIERTRLELVRRVRSDGFPLQDGDVDGLAWSGSGSFILTGQGRFGLALFFVGSQQGDVDIGGYEVRTRHGWAVVAPALDRGHVLVNYTPSEEDVRLDLPQDALTAAAVDSHRNRLFVVSAAGEAAVVDLRTLRVAYREVRLPPEVSGPFLLEWAGQGRLAVWSDPDGRGVPGLWVVDTHDWSVRSVDSTTTDVRASANALVTWNRRSDSGIAIYRPDGTLRLRALAGRRVTRVGVTARYAYVDAGARFSVDLRTGRVAGPLRSRARLVLPDLLDLP